jgi:threonine dehydrogenase-like Zn-dependent dehydrogenase
MDLQGKMAGIPGFGPIGMSVLIPLLHKDANKVYVTDKIDARLEIAKKCGAAWTGNPAKEDVLSAIKLKEEALLDVVFECCGQQDILTGL